MNIFKDYQSGSKRILELDITPDIAKEILSFNTNNRSVSRQRVEMYCKDMIQGNWKSNGVPIIISDKKELKDGQHRLIACVKAEVVLKKQIVMIIPEKDANCYDIGKARTLKDIMEFEGIEDKALKNPVITGSINYCMTLNSNKVPSKLEVIKTTLKYSDACYFVYYNFVTKRSIMGLKRAGVIAAIICAYINNYPEDILLKFLACLSTGVSHTKEDEGVIKLRDYLLRTKTLGRSGQDDCFYRTQSVLKAYQKEKALSRTRSTSKIYYSFPNEVL